MQKYKEINGNDYVKNSRTTINETMQSIQSMNSGTAFPTNNLFEGMKCYRTDLKKTYTLTDVENNTWVEDAHASLSDEATHAASATKLQTARSLNLGGAVTADAATFDGTANATINVKTLDATKLKGTASVSTTGNAATATKVVTTAVDGDSANIAEATMASNDLARIRVSGTTNAGELALETADDGSEPIVARQYTGIYEAPVRTAKILDESGNTSFPGTVVAPKFTGSLNGNAATATKLQTPRTLSLTGKAAGSTTFDGSSNASINVTSVNADTASKLSTARKINITGNASGSTTFDGTSDVSINVSVSQAAHADKATQDTNGRDFTDTNAYMHISALADNTDFNNVKTTGIYYCTGNTYLNRPHGSWGILTVYSIGTVKQEYRPDNAAVYYTREYNTANWTEWSKVNAANADTATIASKVYGIYTANGGQQGPGYFGTNSAGCLMSNQPINGHDEYKNWLYMDNYNGSDVGGATAIGISRTETRAYIMSSNADRKQWDRTAELLSSANYNSFAPTKTGGGASGTWGINISGNADS
ncbi:pyocin knob domain-containing protein, partial [Mitsuokella jalaludinii]|uniref:pyocin knob domain-containing protein n=1 Tax=Mitsuokella jalaludinii TaxID=187979 RepID=UPI00242A6D7C